MGVLVMAATTKRVVSVGCFRDGVSMSSDLRGLTRNRLQPAIYFRLHTGSLPENTGERQPRFSGTIPCPNKFRKKLYVV